MFVQEKPNIPRKVKSIQKYGLKYVNGSNKGTDLENCFVLKSWVLLRNFSAVFQISEKSTRDAILNLFQLYVNTNFIIFLHLLFRATYYSNIRSIFQ